jgi:hypothetical protein
MGQALMALDARIAKRGVFVATEGEDGLVHLLGVDQTADLENGETPQPIKVRMLASAIFSVGDTDVLIKRSANCL